MKNLVCLGLFLFLLGCNNGDDDNNSECNNIACTEEFVTITVLVKDDLGNAVALDDIKVTNFENGNDITREISDLEWQLFRQSGTYPLFGDEYAKDYQNIELEINFKGFINDLEGVNANFIVGADCCHVILVSGDTNLFID
jgi:hypothetical protein